MPRVEKSSVTQYVGTGCKRQLRLSLHPEQAQFATERVTLNLPHPQVRPALREIQNAGDEWGAAKIYDLQTAFGSANLLGGPHAATASTASPGLTYQAAPLLPLLQAGVVPGQFLIETEFDANTPTFRAAHSLDQISFADVPGPLALTRVRPDVIEVMANDGSVRFVDIEGDVQVMATSDTRLVLRIIDVKLTSEPGPRYFAELAYYALTLASFLEEHSLNGAFVVGANPAIWPGRETEAALQAAVAANAPANERYDRFHDDLETVPMRAFLAQVRRVLRVDIPDVLGTPYADLPWSVAPSCQGCENLGQKFSSTPGTSGSAWDPRHCLPEAEATQHLSRLPFLTRGAMQVLRSNGTGSVTDVAAIEPDDAVFDQHHRLRGQRRIVSRRARALDGTPVLAVDADAYTTAAIPGWSRLRLHLTADFDPGSALTLAFGLSWGWLQTGWQPTGVSRTRVHHAEHKTAEAEWLALAGLLDDIATLIDECTAHDREQTLQVYVWDTVTFEHMTRVIGRHLPRILASGRLQRLVWLFPPERLLDSPSLTEAPAVSIVRNAAKATLALDVAHTYTLLSVARAVRADGAPYPLSVPPFWEDPFTDQIPPERAHQVWNQRHAPSAPTNAELLTRLTQTVKTKLRALAEVTDYLTTQLDGRISRRAPKLRQLQPPTLQGATSPMGELLVAYAKLDRAISKLDRAQIRALPTEEKEAKFEVAVIARRLRDSDSARELVRLGLASAPNRRVFTLREGSEDVKVKPGEFTWSLVPEGLAVDLDTAVHSLVNRTDNASLGAWWAANVDYRVTLGDVLNVTVVAIDRDTRTLVLDLTTYGGHASIRDALSGAGLFVNAGRWLLEPLSKEFFVRRLEEATRAIGNPPEALRDPLINDALGQTVRPRTSMAHPAGELIWNAGALSDMAVQRDVELIREEMPPSFRSLNESQDRAWQHALERRVSLIWGPPGTGKTATVRAILEGLARDPRPLRIAVAASTYTAIDTILERVLPRLREDLPRVLVRRLVSEQRPQPNWVPDDAHVPRNSAGYHNLISELDGSRTVIVFGTTEQLHAAITDSERAGSREVFDVLIIDEAGQLDVGHAMLLLSGAATGAQLIVAGDHLQLAPIHAAEPPLGLENKVGSIYTYLREDQGVPQLELLVNYRSNETLVELGKLAGYPAALMAHRPNLRLRYRSDVDFEEVRDVLGVSDSLVQIAAPSQVGVALPYLEGVSGQWNDFEARTVVDIVRWYREVLLPGVSSGVDDVMTDEYFWTEAVGVVSLHRAQRTRIIQLLRSAFTGDQHAEASLHGWIDGAVDTVERFQGQERDVIIASYAVGDPDTVAEEETFLHDLNRFNVLATRPRAKLIVLASREIIQHTSSDLQVIRASEMLKDFVEVFCADGPAMTLPSAGGDVVVEFRAKA